MVPATVLSISSQVAYGHVGNSVSVPALQASGNVVVAVPTLISSNHPGLGRPFGFQVTADQLVALLAALETGGALDPCAAVITGYFVAADQVAAVAGFLRRLKARERPPYVMVDAIIGDDDKGRFVPEEVATALRDVLRPLADGIKANRFELQWITGAEVVDSTSASKAARMLGVAEVLASSIPAGPSRMANILVAGEAVAMEATRKLAGVPKGTGDLLTALWVAARLSGLDRAPALADASRRLSAVIAASRRGSTLVLDPLYHPQERPS